MKIKIAAEEKNDGAYNEQLALNAYAVGDSERIKIINSQLYLTFSQRPPFTFANGVLDGNNVPD
jgi:hypothetical protein